MATTTEIPGTITHSQKALLKKTWWKKAAPNNSNNNNNNNYIPPFHSLKITERGVFGIPLLESLRYAHSRISYTDDRTGETCNGMIPTVIAKCGAFLKEQALNAEGIFRLSGNAKRISMLQTLFDTPEHYGLDIDWRNYTVHDAANVMRRFLNHLPEPVIILAHQHQYKSTLDTEFPNLEAKIDAFQKLIEQLPVVHQHLLLYMLDLLSLFSMYSDVTRMDVSSLATAFAPGLLSDPNDPMNLAGYKESQRVLVFLIEHQDRLFMPAWKPIYTNPGASRSVTDVHSFAHNSTNLKRANTAPSQRHLSKHEPPQIVYVNNNNKSTSSLASNGTKKLGRWKSISIVKDKKEGVPLS
ncbi:Rho GTPase activation protein [Backusella circina FSU 941]|nr:Rho GTPase activation protein [Backusella circina FSU 941]